MVHARLGEFIKCYNIQQAAATQRRIKGGQSLRDELFSVTKKRKKNVKEHESEVFFRRNTENLVNKLTPVATSKVCLKIKKRQLNVERKNSGKRINASAETANSEYTPTSRSNSFLPLSCSSKMIQSTITESININHAQSPARKSQRKCKSKKVDIYYYE